MAHDPNTLKKTAVLTGLTMLIGGAEISNADANTIFEPTQNFPPPTLNIPFSSGGGSTSGDLTFAGFNSSLGTLTQVEVVLNSTITSTSPPPITLTASVTLAGQSVGSASTPGTFDEDAFFTTLSCGCLSSFETASLTAHLALSISDGFATWAGSGSPAGLTVTYSYTPTSTTPLPATLPLFTSGLAGLGFITWRRRRKLTAKE